jgi:hypothetical protein
MTHTVPALYSHLTSKRDRSVGLMTTLQHALDQGDTLVMLVMHKHVHLAMARPAPPLSARLTLCDLPVAGSEGICTVEDEDLPVLQDFTICISCARAFAANLRDGMIARAKASGQSGLPPLCQERIYLEANQLSLF